MSDRRTLEVIQAKLSDCLDNDNPADWEDYFNLLEEIYDLVKAALQ